MRGCRVQCDTHAQTKVSWPQQFGASKTFVDKTVWPIHLPKTFSVSKRWFCVPGVVPFLFDLLDSRCPKSRPHFEGGLPDK